MDNLSGNSISVGLLGCGVVGAGVAKLLAQNGDLIASRIGMEIKLAKAADINPDAVADLNLADGVYTNDAMDVINDPTIPIIVELIGGQGIAKDFVLAALNKGKTVVTANKALIAAYRDEIAEACEKSGADFLFEASVGGCMPVIKSLRESLVSNKVDSIFGILNGTCNYILTQITQEGMPFDQALAQAQELGFAEADPTLDVEGMDTVHKLALSVALAFGTRVNYKEIYVDGITRITPLDITIAAEFGYSVKLLAIAKNHGDFVEARVHPTMIPHDNLLSSVGRNMNAVKIVGDAVGEMVLYGAGAGMMPTASAVVGDIVDAARNIQLGCHPRIPAFSYQPAAIRELPLMPMDELVSRYYVRFSALDRPGVLSKVSGVLAKYSISIASVHQKGRHTEGPVPIVMLTHEAKEANIRKALEEVGSLDVIAEAPMLIRIEDENQE
ncbi:homoserine dehydrogenase [Desulfatibacillum aliphaticivorans]|uniref:homoserine dehydrogenase n=1 Tax=Desulfatibacillum aliphaticivorans TaxID=218208 RepID=UPI0004054FF8|nr:homoserine dehydrogenase [Desulfatibacillum aliphaticivorans]